MFPRLASRRLCFVIFLALGVCFVPFFDMTFNILVPPCNSTLSKLRRRGLQRERGTALGRGLRLARTSPASLLPAMAPARPRSILEAPRWHRHALPACALRVRRGQRESVCETRTEGVPSPPATSQMQPCPFKSFSTRRLSGNVQVFLIAHVPARQVKQAQFLLHEEETKAREGC